MSELARQLRAARRKKKHGQLRAAADLGVSQSQLSNYEMDRTPLPEERWPVFAAYLGISQAAIEQLSREAAEQQAPASPTDQLAARVEKLEDAVATIGDEQSEQRGMLRTVLELLGTKIPSPKRRAVARRAR